MFTKQELQQLSYFLNKVTLNGTESVAHATLLIKIQKLLEEKAPTKE